MPCFSPLKGFVGRRNPKTGRSPTVFNVRYSPSKVPRVINCGQCVGCRLEKSRQWAIRCVHEASMHKDNCFITLTYNDANLPPTGLFYRDFQLFLKRLRKKFGKGIRFYMCGEYGENFGRPHYHALIFGFDFKDKYRWRRSPTGHYLFRSPDLEDLWPLGNSEIGSVTFESAAYCARYIMKKVTGDAAIWHYSSVDQDGVIIERKPEFTQMSLRQGIAKPWFDKFHATDVVPNDHVVLRGIPMRPPRYYDHHFEILNPVEFKKMKLRRKAQASCNAADNTPDRLRVKEQVVLARSKKLIRPMEVSS